MAEDGIGWRAFSFTTEDQLVFRIVNSAAVEASERQLSNEIAGAARANSNGLSNAKEKISHLIECRIDDPIDEGQTGLLSDDYGLL